MPAKRVEALKHVFTNRDPFCKGVCPVPKHQLLCYYGHNATLNQIDFARPTTQQLEALSRACDPAPPQPLVGHYISFSLNNEDVLDEACRKAGKIDLDAFATLFDPRTLGIHDIIEHDLLAFDQAVEFELSKLNVYAKGGFFKSHQDTPRADTMFGSLVVVFPAHHEGGQLALRLSDQKWIVDFADQFAAAAEPSICFVALFSDVEHEVLPVTSGYRVTLTYNLHFRAQSNIPRVLSGPFHDRLKEKLIALVDDAETLPKEGYLGIGLCHQYVYDETKPIDSLVDQLKGSDAALANVCKEFGLPYSLRLLYAQGKDVWPHFHLLSRVKLDALAPGPMVGGNVSEMQRRDYSYSYDDDDLHYLLRSVIAHFGPEDIEGVEIIGRKLDPTNGLDHMEEGDTYDFMKKYYKDPVPQVLEVKDMSSMLCESSYLCYGIEDRFYATACMMITVKPVESRKAPSS